MTLPAPAMLHNVQGFFGAASRGFTDVYWKGASSLCVGSLYPSSTSTIFPLVCVGSTNLQRRFNTLIDVQNSISCTNPPVRNAEKSNVPPQGLRVSTLRQTWPSSLLCKTITSACSASRTIFGAVGNLREYSANCVRTAHACDASDEFVVKELLEALGRIAPIFPVRAENISFLETPDEFYQVRDISRFPDPRYGCPSDHRERKKRE
jgi:hypothetical protein